MGKRSQLNIDIFHSVFYIIISAQVYQAWIRPCSVYTRVCSTILER